MAFNMFVIIVLVSTLFGCISSDRPHIAPMAQYPVLNEGSKFAVLCQIISGTRPLEFIWSRDGKIITAYDYRYSLENDDFKSILNIERVTVNYAGNYTCTVRNGLGEDSQSVALQVASINGEVVVQPQQVPPYLRSTVIIPFSVALTIMVLACIVGYAYVKYEDRKVEKIKAGFIPSHLAKNFQYFSGGSVSSGTPLHSGRQSIVSEEGTVTIRYHDQSDKCKPLMARPPVPTMFWSQTQEPIIEENEDPYSTLPFQHEHDLAPNLTSFKTTTDYFPKTDHQLPPPPPPDTPKRFSRDDRAFGLMCQAPPKQSLGQANGHGQLLCKVQVHSHESSAHV